MTQPTYHLGIDPGVRNLAISLIDDSSKFIAGQVFDVRPPDTDIRNAIDSVTTMILTVTGSGNKIISSVGIERYVPYAGTYTNNAEEILMLTGAIVYVCQRHVNLIHPPEIRLFRAIDWKPSLCKTLVKTKSFSNPSTSFDKKYSKAAAEAITGTPFKNDHLADSTCLAFHTWTKIQTTN